MLIDGACELCRGIPAYDGLGSRYCTCTDGVRGLRRFEGSLEAVFAGRAGLPKRLGRCTIAAARQLHPNNLVWQQALRAADAFTRHVADVEMPPKGLLTMGPTGIGKSGLMAGIALRLRQIGRPVLWLRYDSLWKAQQDSYGTPSDGMPLRTAQQVQWLVLDELGDPFARGNRFVESENRRAIVFDLVAHRHERMLPMLITSNHHSVHDIAEQFDPRIADRLREACTIITVEGAESLRR